MGERLARPLYRKRYYEKNRVHISKYQLEVYIPRVTREIQKQIPEKVQELYQKYPFETYGDPLIRKCLCKWGIQEHHLAFQDCYDAAIETYLYSIHRCALCGYEYVEYYIKKMIPFAVIWGLNIHNEGRNICREHHFRQVELDGLEGTDLW
ncbi:MAG: hypothetical protein HFI32_05735 [Lachnospiraceae bacterium]|nr:hypothetical protein [Lachnospiraceae bacterium]